MSSAGQLAVHSMRRVGLEFRRGGVGSGCSIPAGEREADERLKRNLGVAARREARRHATAGAVGLSLSRSTRAGLVAGGEGRAADGVLGWCGWCGWRWWLRGGLREVSAARGGPWGRLGRRLDARA